MSEIMLHPVQARSTQFGKVSSLVTLRAYEVYLHTYGEQRELVTGNCRGGFSVGELVAYLYARTFPQEEWRSRADEALNGMTLP